MKQGLKFILEDKDENYRVGQVRNKGELDLVSADKQIDGVLLSFKLQVIQNIAELNNALESKSLQVLIENEEEAGKETVKTSADVKDVGPTKSETVSINVDAFANHVREFVDTAHNTMDISSVIVNRARNIVKDKHEHALSAFDEALSKVGLGKEPRYGNEPDDRFQGGAVGGGGA